MQDKVTDNEPPKRRTTTFTMPECESDSCYTPYLVDYEPLDKSSPSDLDCDLSRTDFEDTVICELVLWLHKCERYMGHDPETVLVNHDTEELSSTVGFTPAYPLYVWQIRDGRFAVSYHAGGPYAILPHGYCVLTIRKDHAPDIVLVRYL